MKFVRLKSMFLLITLLLVLFGCSGGTSPEEKIYETLEKVVSVEKEFKDQQSPLAELEKKEKEIYDQIISLNMDDYDQIVKLADEALDIVKQRESHLKNEYESIQASKEEFEKVNSIINDLKEEPIKEEAQKLVSLMNERYNSYENLYSNYNEAITYDKELYSLFKKEDLTLEELEAQITKINETYEKVVSANDSFNQFTDQYNQAKITFYKNAGLNVVDGAENEK